MRWSPLFLISLGLFLSAPLFAQQASASDTPSDMQTTDTPNEVPGESVPQGSFGQADDETATQATAGAASALVTTEALKADSDTSSALPAKKPEKAEHLKAPFSLTGGFWNMDVFGFTAGQLTVSFVILFISLIFRNVIALFIFRRLHVLTKRTKFDFDDDLVQALEKPVSWFIFFLGLYVSLAILPLDDDIAILIQNLFHGSTMLLIVWGMLRLVDVTGDVMARRIKDQRSAIFGFIPLLKKTVKVFILCVGILMVIDNLGYNVAGILATLGLGGAAIALAAKDTVANFFGSLMIVLDRPFKVGDWIIVGDKVDGDVESIGLRSTKVRTWPKTVMSIPNSILANEYINNWSRMPKRRVKQYVGISYEASAEDMEGLVQDIRQLLAEDDGVQQDFILVNFTDFGDSSLDVLVYYFTKSTAWVEHMDVRQRVNCKVMRAIKARGLSVAFPTRSLYLEGEVARKMAGYQDGLPDDFGPNSPQ